MSNTDEILRIEFSAQVWYWRGPAPFYFVTVPEAPSSEIKEIERFVTYGWGMIPAVAEIGGTRWKTALWPKDGHYILPLKTLVRRSEAISECDLISTVITVEGAMPENEG